MKRWEVHRKPSAFRGDGGWSGVCAGGMPVGIRSALLVVGLFLTLASPAPILAQNGGGIFGRKPAQAVAVSSIVLAIHPFIDRSQYPLITSQFDGESIRVSQWFLGQFTNSYHDRSIIAAVERHWGAVRWGVLEVGAGYRAGIVTGYNERLISIAEHTPVLPLFGVVGWTYVGPIGVQVFYAYRAASVEGAIRCC